MRRVVTIARIAAVYLLLGFVATWAVAWGLAAFVPISRLDERTRLQGDSPFVVSVVTQYAMGAARARYVGGVPLQGAILVDAEGYTFQQLFAGDHNPLRETVTGDEFVIALDLTAGQGWGTRHDFVAHGFDGAWDAGMDDARGLPFLCLWSTREIPHRTQWPPPPLAAAVGGINLPPWTSTQTTDPMFLSRALPYYPIWSGLALNTAFYAVLFFVSVRMPKALLRSRRFGRGLCPKCKYNREFDYRLPCPECGDAPRGERHERRVGAAEPA